MGAFEILLAKFSFPLMIFGKKKCEIYSSRVRGKKGTKQSILRQGSSEPLNPYPVEDNI